MEKLFYIGVKALIFNKHTNKVLMLKRAGMGYWDLPGGRINQGESMNAALKREVKEEANITEIETIGQLIAYEARGVFIPIGDTENSAGLMLSVYTCSVDNVDIKLSEEHDEFKWCTVEESVSLLSDAHQELKQIMTLMHQNYKV